MARPSSAGRPGVSPCQNGSRPGCPGAGVTSTRSGVMSSIRHELAPSTNTSPTRDSYTISSSSSPTRRGWPAPWSPEARNTPNSPRSGMVPPLVTASRCAPGRARMIPATRSQMMRGRSPAKSSLGYRPASMSSTASRIGLVSPANGAAWRTSRSSSSTGQSSTAVIATTCWASTSSGLCGSSAPRSGRPASARPPPRPGAGRPGTWGR